MLSSWIIMEVKMASLRNIILFSLFYQTLLAAENIENRQTGLMDGVQEKLKMLEGTVNTLMILFNDIKNKVDANTEGRKRLHDITEKVERSSKVVDSMKKTIVKIKEVVSPLTAKIQMVDSMKKTIVKIKEDVDANTEGRKRLDDITEKVERSSKVVGSMKKTIVKIKEDVSPLTAKCDSLPFDICGSCKCRDDGQISKKYFCDCTNLPAKRDCKQHHDDGAMTDGIYLIHQNNIRIIRVFCDQNTEGGGWTVFQRRVDGSLKFYRDWDSYKKGFGKLQHEFWIGNTNLFTLSLQGLYPSGNELRIELTDWMGTQKIAKYSSFEVRGEDHKFQLSVGGYSGTAGDSLTYHSGIKFTTFDQDNDQHPTRNCAVLFTGAWWYSYCLVSNLNGQYQEFGYWIPNRGICWSKFHGLNYSLKRAEMKIRRNK